MKDKEKLLHDLNLPTINLNGVVESLMQASNIMRVLLGSVSRLQNTAITMNTDLTHHLIPREYWDANINRDKKQQYISLPDDTGWEKGFSFVEILERLKQRPNNDVFIIKGSEVWLESTLSFKLNGSGWKVYVLGDSGSGYTITNGEVVDTLNKLLAKELGLLLPLRAEDSPYSMTALRTKKKLLDDIHSSIKLGYQWLKEINLTTGKTTYDIPKLRGKFAYYHSDFDPVLKIDMNGHGTHTLSIIHNGKGLVICNGNGVIDQTQPYALKYQECQTLALAVDELTKSLKEVKGNIPTMMTTANEAVTLFNTADLSHRYHLVKRKVDIVIKFDHPELSTWHSIRVPYTLKLGINKELKLPGGGYLPHDKVNDMCANVINAMAVMDRTWATETEVTDFFFAHLLNNLSECFTNTDDVEVPFIRFDSTPVEIEIPNDNKHNTVFVHPESLAIEDVKLMLSAIFNPIGMDVTARDKEIVVRLSKPVCDSKLKGFIYDRYQVLNEL